MENAKKQDGKSIYHRPQVNDYGNIKGITMATTMGGAVKDGASSKTA